MTTGQTKNTALKTMLAFNYQVLVGLEQCFAMREGQTVWFEMDGDVSLHSDDGESQQIEVKNYADTLTDNHENLWKTLKNWLAQDFEHEKYDALVLHTTQVFGANTRLNGWNSQDCEHRLKILQDIFAARPIEEREAKEPTQIVKLQRTVLEADPERLKGVLSKVVICTEADDRPALRNSILSRLIGIPESNLHSYFQGLIGFVYDRAESNQWVVAYAEFKEKCTQLTSDYCRKEFTLPTFKGLSATKEEAAQHEEKLFVQKIKSIEYEDVIADAIGNWIELHNSLHEELDGAPQFRRATEEYQRQLLTQYKSKHAIARRNCKDVIRDSQNLYDTVIGETPSPLRGYHNPPIEYKNGLIHDMMDNDEHELQWSVKP